MQIIINNVDFLSRFLAISGLRRYVFYQHTEHINIPEKMFLAVKLVSDSIVMFLDN